MRIVNHVMLYSLLLSFSISSILMADKKAEALQKKKIEDTKTNLALKGLGILTAVAASLCILKVDALKDSGLNIGLAAATALYGASCVCEKENSIALTQMAIAAPIITTIGSAVMSDAFAGTNGFLAHCPMFGIDRIAETGQAKSPAFAALSVLVTYRAAQPAIDKITAVIGKRLPITGRHFKESEHQQ